MNERKCSDLVHSKTNQESA